MKAILFKDFITFQRGFDLPRKDMVEGPYPVVGSTSIVGQHNEYKKEPPGVITGRSGSLGVVQYIKERYWPHNTSLWVKDFKGNSPKYVYYFLKTFPLAHFNSGAGVPTLNRNDLDAYEIKIHDYDTQRRIVGILSAYDDLIENNTCRIKILEEMAQRIYKEWFVDFRYPGHENDKLVESELGMIPEGWEVKQLKDLGGIITGKTPSKKIPEYYGGSIPFIKIPDMNGNVFCISTGEYLSESGAESQKKKTLPPNTLCVSCIGSAGIVSITAIPSQTNQQINSVVLRDDSVREFLYFALLDLRETIKLHGATGATMANLSKGKFESLKLVTTPNDINSKYHGIAGSLFDQILTLQYANATLRQARDLLLPKLISGQIDVSELDINVGVEE